MKYPQLAGLTAAALVGGTVPVSGLLVDYPLLTGQAGRFLLGAGVLAAYMRVRRIPLGRLRLTDLPALAAVVGIGMLGFNATLIAAQEHADPGLVAAVLGGSPLLLALAGPLLARQRPAVAAVAGAAVVVAGVAVLSGGGSWSGPGLLLAVLTMLGEVGFTLFAVGLIRRHGGYAASFWTHLGAGVGGAAIAAVVDTPRLPTATEAAALATVAVLAVFAACLWFSCVSTLGAGRAGVLIGAMPVAGLLVSVLIGAEPLRPAGVVGTLLVATGCVIGLRPPRAEGASGRRGPFGGRPRLRPVGTR
ncbi:MULTISPECIES: DMT family transporter [Actinokineospora]|uniref:DMT family transporter n=1 Tax=Actinokineospora TaxID=39845 RepID=UPI001E543BF0|nr:MULTISPECIES: DMT family transporter [Actinokineospora]